MNMIKIAGACLNQTPLDWKNNLQNIVQAIQAARKEGVSLLCLPEMAISGYGCEDWFFAESVLERSLKSLEAIVAATENMVVSVGLPLKFENCLYNVVALIQNKQLLGFVAKQELAGEGVHYEPRWFKAWKENMVAMYTWNGESYPLGDVIFEIDGVRIGFEICEDAWNGRRPAQKHYLNNVDIILNPSASHFAFGKTKVREGIVREGSRSYCCTYVYSNLIGNESGRVIYDGEILIAQNGTLLARNQRFSYQNFQILAVTVDVEGPRNQKKKIFSFSPELNSHLVEGNGSFPKLSGKGVVSKDLVYPFESKEEEFYKAVCLGLFDYMRKSQSHGFVLSLSGGSDSTACAVLVRGAIQNAIEELGIEVFKNKISYFTIDETKPVMGQFLTCVYQATSNSSAATEESATKLCEEIGATFYRWDINAVVQEYVQTTETSFQRKLTWQQDDIALQNIQSRVRAPGVWLVANTKKALLLTTSNRSEAALGYATVDGDTAGGLGPLCGIDKSFLLTWLRWAEQNLGLKSLQYVNKLKSTAELRPADQHQLTEVDLMSYTLLNEIEKCAVRSYQSPLEVWKTLRGTVEDNVLKQAIRKFFRLWASTQWKRERYAPSFHLDDANLDPRTWCRFPILNGGYELELEELERMK